MSFLEGFGGFSFSCLAMRSEFLLLRLAGVEVLVSGSISLPERGSAEVEFVRFRDMGVGFCTREISKKFDF